MFATPRDQIKLIPWKQYSLQRDWRESILKRFSLRVSSLCPLLSHSDCGIIYLKLSVTYNIIFRTPERLSVFKPKYEACNVMKPSPNLVIQ